MWYAVVINTDAEKAFRIYSTREQVVFGRAGRKILPARTKSHLLAFKPDLIR